MVWVQIFARTIYLRSGYVAESAKKKKKEFKWSLRCLAVLVTRFIPSSPLAALLLLFLVCV